MELEPNMNFPPRCDFCLKEIEDHLFHVPCTTGSDIGRSCGPDTTATVFGLAGKLLQERNEAIIYIKRLEATIDPVREWFDVDGEITDVVQMLTEAISELQKDRNELLGMGAAVVAGADKAEIQTVDWYSPEEVREWLIKNNYSLEIAGDIAGLFAEHMQKSFNKGHEAGERRVAELELKMRAADALVRVIDRQTEIGLLGSRTSIADARLDYGQPFKYEAKEQVRIAALEEDWKNAVEFMEYIRDSMQLSVSPELRIAARKILMGKDW